ncbi:hypothetical protein NQ318_004418 [Aromia moschata]|uniref:Ribokinase n=1 Tax=Aromia moschata TaxID=1265417 RepID=A0AAV8Y408_9CUCU|nr:hypothetical protein NQ318_004418 [Aromia moschata]
MVLNNIVVVGSCMIDLVSYAPRLPFPGETIHGSKFVTTYGGKGANQCVAASKLGGKTALVARVGDDIWGKKYIENLKKENVSTLFVKEMPQVSTGIAQIIVSDSGENQIVIVAGANDELTRQDVENAKTTIKEAAVVVLQLETSVDIAIKTMELCKGISILNGAPALGNYNPKLLKLPTIFCVNESEASIFAGIPVNSKRDAERAAFELLSKGCNSVLITLGAQGALYVSKREKKCYHFNSPSVKCIDSTGAGDAFIGALAYLLANKKDLLKSIEMSCIIAADSVTRQGTQISFPDSDILKTLEHLSRD